jgi:hypothetical protein
LSLCTPPSWNSNRRRQVGAPEIRATLSDLGGIAIPPPPRKTFEAEGKLLNDTLRRTHQERNAALKNLCGAVKKFEPYLQHSDLRCSEYAHALQDLKKALAMPNTCFRLKRCVAATVEPPKRKNSLGSTTSRSRTSSICRSATTSRHAQSGRIRSVI